MDRREFPLGRAQEHGPLHQEPEGGLLLRAGEDLPEDGRQAADVVLDLDEGPVDVADARTGREADQGVDGEFEQDLEGPGEGAAREDGVRVGEEVAPDPEQVLGPAVGPDDLAQLDEVVPDPLDALEDLLLGAQRGRRSHQDLVEVVADDPAQVGVGAAGGEGGGVVAKDADRERIQLLRGDAVRGGPDHFGQVAPGRVRRREQRHRPVAVETGDPGVADGVGERLGVHRRQSALVEGVEDVVVRDAAEREGVHQLDGREARLHVELVVRDVVPLEEVVGGLERRLVALCRDAQHRLERLDLRIEAVEVLAEFALEQLEQAVEERPQRRIARLLVQLGLGEGRVQRGKGAGEGLLFRDGGERADLVGLRVERPQAQRVGLEPVGQLPRKFVPEAVDRTEEVDAAPHHLGGLVAEEPFDVLQALRRDLPRDDLRAHLVDGRTDVGPVADLGEERGARNAVSEAGRQLVRGRAARRRGG